MRLPWLNRPLNICLLPGLCDKGIRGFNHGTYPSRSFGRSPTPAHLHALAQPWLTGCEDRKR